jgi:hypothetical protein
MPLRWLLVALSLFAPAAALALTPVALCNGQTIEPLPDGRMLGHIPYPEGNQADMVAMPGNFGVGRACELHRDAAAAMTALLAAADQVPEVKGKLRGISCFRSNASAKSSAARSVPASGAGMPQSVPGVRARQDIASMPPVMRSTSRSGR